jgi:hypothetical protein
MIRSFAANGGSSTSHARSLVVCWIAEAGRNNLNIIHANNISQDVNSPGFKFEPSTVSYDVLSHWLGVCHGWPFLAGGAALPSFRSLMLVFRFSVIPTAGGQFSSFATGMTG